MMSRIRAKGTKPEMLVRKGLHGLGLRYRLHDKRLPGKPDLVFPRYRAVVFVHGCFWHGHDCPNFKWPKTREEFWKQKIGTNRVRDDRQKSDLKADSWRIAIVWECRLKRTGPEQLASLTRQLAEWVRQDKPPEELPDEPRPFEVF